MIDQPEYVIKEARGAAGDAAGPGRRSVLRTGTGGVVGLGLAGLAGLPERVGSGARTARAVSGPGAPVPPLPPFRLFRDPDLNFETLGALGSAGYGCSEVGEIVSAVNDINAHGASYQSYYDTFVVLALALARLAASELRAGHWASARSAYLRAAMYYDLCLFFVLGTASRAQEADVYAAMQRCWHAASQLFDPPFERVQIPYGRTSMPGYFLRPDTSGVRRPTVILNNSSDGQNIDLFAFGGAAAVERGYNALIFEGPGQGSMLFERQVFFRPDWQHVITPVANYLRSRPDVDSARLALTGWSMCGESVICAAAFEHRLAAVVADPGVHDAWLAWPAPIRGLFALGASKAEINHIWLTEIVPELDPQQRFLLAKRAEPFGTQYLTAARAGKMFTDLYDLGQAIMKVDCSKVAGQVAAPTLVTSYQFEQFYPGQAAQVFRLLRSAKDLHTFTVAEGAGYHGAPMAPQTRNQVVFDWLGGTL